VHQSQAVKLAEMFGYDAVLNAIDMNHANRDFVSARFDAMEDAGVRALKATARNHLIGIAETIFDDVMSVRESNKELTQGFSPVLEADRAGAAEMNGEIWRDQSSQFIPVLRVDRGIEISSNFPDIHLVSSLAASQRLNDDETIGFRFRRTAELLRQHVADSTSDSGDFKPRRFSPFASFTDPERT
jgi:hypothetical protein